MFRLLFALILALILRSLANAQNKSTVKVPDNTTQGNQCGKSFSKECCNGRNGRDGRDGQHGKDGRDGRDGMKGEKGEQGICERNSGINGTKGEKGEQGNSGINGAKGDKGEQGLRGNDGTNGRKVPDNTATQGNQCEKSFSKECCNGRDGRDGRDGQHGKDGRDGRDGRNGVKGEKGEQGICQGNSGINGAKGEKGELGLRGNDGTNGTKGQKGEPGSSAKSTNGTMQFTNTADNCTLHTAGTVRYTTSLKALELCDGSAWLPLVTARTGHVASNPGHHCLDILNSAHSHGNGLYWIDPNGGSTDDAFQAFCDMETEGGGWTLVATKVSPSFLFIKTAFSTLAAKTKNADAASHIHPDMGDWEEVLFRFADVNTIRVIYNRKAGAPQNGKIRFDNFLMGKPTSSDTKVYGFYKYSQADHNRRNPSTGFAIINRMAIYSKPGRGVAEYFADSDKWLNLWHQADGSNNYVTSDDSRARGTKCIAGYCYLNKPIWVMVR